MSYCKPMLEMLAMRSVQFDQFLSPDLDIGHASQFGREFDSRN